MIDKDMFKVVDTNDEDENLEDELIDQYQKMIADKDTKLKAAKKQLIDNLKVTAEKYETASGTMAAIDTIRSIWPDYLSKPDAMDDFENLEFANKLSKRMASTARDMADKANGLDYEEMNELCNGFYEPDYRLDHKNFFQLSAVALAEELMRIDLCRNVGPAADDIVGFIERVDIDIADIEAKLDEIDTDWRDKLKEE